MNALLGITEALCQLSEYSKQSIRAAVLGLEVVAGAVLLSRPKRFHRRCSCFGIGILC